MHNVANFRFMFKYLRFKMMSNLNFHAKIGWESMLTYVFELSRHNGLVLLTKEFKFSRLNALVQWRSEYYPSCIKEHST